MIITKDEFNDWKSHPITKAVFSEIEDRIQKVQQELGDNAGTEPLYDRFRVGAIAGYRDLLNIAVDEVSDD